MTVKLKNLTGAPITIRTKVRDINLGVDGPAPEFTPCTEYLPSVPVDLGEDAIEMVGLADTAIDCNDLPDPEHGVLFIVPGPLAQHPYLAIRADLVCPGTSIVDGEGKIEAYDGLCAGVGLSLLLFDEDRPSVAADTDSEQQTREPESKPEKGPELQPAA